MAWAKETEQGWFASTILYCHQQKLASLSQLSDGDQDCWEPFSYTFSIRTSKEQRYNAPGTLTQATFRQGEPHTPSSIKNNEFIAVRFKRIRQMKAAPPERCFVCWKYQKIMSVSIGQMSLRYRKNSTAGFHPLSWAKSAANLKYNIEIGKRWMIMCWAACCEMLWCGRDGWDRYRNRRVDGTPTLAPNAAYLQTSSELLHSSSLTITNMLVIRRLHHLINDQSHRPHWRWWFFWHASIRSWRVYVDKMGFIPRALYRFVEAQSNVPMGFECSKSWLILWIGLRVFASKVVLAVCRTWESLMVGFLGYAIAAVLNGGSLHCELWAKHNKITYLIEDCNTEADVFEGSQHDSLAYRKMAAKHVSTSSWSKESTSQYGSMTRCSPLVWIHASDLCMTTWALGIVVTIITTW